jgi:hypothetical protein
MMNVDAVSDMLKPFDARLMRSFLVGTRVNHGGERRRGMFNTRESR